MSEIDEDKSWGDEDLMDEGWSEDGTEANREMDLSGADAFEEDTMDEGWEMESMTSPGMEHPSLERGHSYEVLSISDLSKKQESLINNVKEQLYIDREEAAILLRYYHWKSNKLIDDWLLDSDKVRNHVGIHAFPENSLKSISKDFLCSLCDDLVPFANTTALSCEHRFCNTCWSKWLSAETDKGPASVFSTCPAYKCKEIVPERVFLSFLDEHKKKIFQTWLIDSLIQGNRSLKWCPSPGCCRAVEYKSGGMKEVSCSCGHVFCFKCENEGHRPADCDLVAKWTRKNSTDSENANWIIANTKRCPKCDVYIEKNQGCNHMTCQNCKHEFCWLCKGKWSDHGSATGGYYKCNKYELEISSEASHEEVKIQEAKNALQKYLFYFSRFDNHNKSIKFAEETRRKAEQRMGELQDKLGTNYQDVQFILNAVNAVVSCRRVLKWTYCFGYYLEGELEKQIFENHQERLEKFTEELHGLTEKTTEDLRDTKVRTQIVNYTRVVEKYRKNVIEAIENGLKG